MSYYQPFFFFAHTTDISLSLTFVFVVLCVCFSWVQPTAGAAAADGAAADGAAAAVIKEEAHLISIHFDWYTACIV